MSYRDLYQEDCTAPKAYDNIPMPQGGYFGNQGWICPKCGRVYSPYTSMCPNCGKKEYTTTNEPNIIY